MNDVNDVNEEVWKRRTKLVAHGVWSLRLGTSRVGFLPQRETEQEGTNQRMLAGRSFAIAIAAAAVRVSPPSFT